MKLIGSLGVSPLPTARGLPTLRLTCVVRRGAALSQWVNTPVLMEALDRYEQRRLPRSMQLWVEAVLELDRSPTTPLRPHC